MNHKVSRIKVPKHLRKQYDSASAKIRRSIRRYKIITSNIKRKCETCDVSLSVTEMTDGRSECEKCRCKLKTFSILTIPEHLKEQYKIAASIVNNSVKKYKDTGYNRGYTYCRVKIPDHLIKEYQKNEARTHRSVNRYQITDVYVKRLIVAGFEHKGIKIKREDITPEMIDIKRQMIQMSRKRKAL